MKYNVTIKEILARTVQVEAGSVEEAESAARKMYHNCDIVLSADDYVTTEIVVE
ncbi:DpnD/PcfM family protein [Leyella stercorea]|jgi:hypothetical protein|uniref:DpnD/PcfM family protein n=1 Tax=Leyella stercorea TaxID=363265 RepID=UPI00242F2D03|nr:DpnD/PcfM family protein [Leyella stercorea]